MEPTGNKPPLPDTTRPNQARVHDYLLGGKDNYAADRQAAETLLDPAQGGHPEMRTLARENREFTGRAVRLLAAIMWIDQFADLGCGLPLRPYLHERAREAEPDARFAYVDKDPVVLNHVRAVEATSPGLAAVEADVTDPGKVLEQISELRDAEGRALIDFASPAGLVLGGTLSDMDADTARNVMAGFAAVLAPGSAVIISCANFDDDELAARISGMFAPDGTWRNHGRDDVTSFFEAGGLRLMRGGVDDVRSWLLLPAVDGRTARVLGGVGVLD